MRLQRIAGGPHVVVILLALLACDYNAPWPPDGRIYDMTDSGVVESVEEMESDGWRVTLTRGEESPSARLAWMRA